MPGISLIFFRPRMASALKMISKMKERRREFVTVKLPIWKICSALREMWIVDLGAVSGIERLNDNGK